MNQELLLTSAGDHSSLQNLEFLRRLIAESRSEQPYDDVVRLRMAYGGMGADLQEQRGEL